jgi:predicted ATPase
MAASVPAAVSWLSAVGAPGRRSFERRVRDALARLHDPVVLQTHPLAGHVRVARPGDPVSAGQALQTALLEVIAALRPESGSDPAWGRAHALLVRRYVDGLSAPAVQAKLAIGKSEYYRAHGRALAAVASLLAERCRLDDPPPRDGPATARPSAAGRLPRPLTSFVGRDAELREVRRLLGAAPLVTLTGPPGVGKTRLARETAAGLGDLFPDGVYLVPLASLGGPELVLPAVARALDVRAAGSRPLEAALAAALGAGRILLVLDNCEHVLAAAPDVAALLAACPGLAVLATSRAPLRLSGEQELPLPALPLPDPGDPPTRARVAASGAVRLFVERARAVRPEFALTEENAAEVAAVCARLDGLPLALELAAARVRALTPGALLARLQSRLVVLTGGARDAPDRHQTLRAAIDWSYRLLGERDRTLLRRMAVFAGGCTLEAVRSVCAGDGQPPGARADPGAADVLDGVAVLLENSLLVRHQDGSDEPRFAMLDTIREYAWERLEAEDDATAARDRHAGWCLALAEEAHNHIHSPDQATWLDRLEREHANLRAALGWCRQREDAERSLRFGAALWSFWALRGHVAEGRAYLADALAGPGAPTSPNRPRCLFGAGRLALNHGDLQAARRWYERALTLAREVGLTSIAEEALNGLASLARQRGDLAVARAFLEQSLALAAPNSRVSGIGIGNAGLVALEEGDHAGARALFEQTLERARSRGNRHGVAVSLMRLGFVAHGGGDHGRARALHEESLALLRAFGDKRALALVLANLGLVEVDLADLRAAGAYLVESAQIARDVDDGTAIALALEGFAGLAAAQADAERAGRLHGAAAALRRTTGPPPRVVREWLGRRLCGAPATVEGDGAALTADEAIAYALGSLVIRPSSVEG